MNYEVGDKVRIREDLTGDKWYGVVDNMMKYVGKIATIASGISNHFEFKLDIDNGMYNWTPEMFDQNYKPESENYMKTSEFKKELNKLGYRLNINTYIHRIKDNATVAIISSKEVNIIDTDWHKPVSDELFNLITKYAATPIAEREDEKLFNVQIIKGNWGRMSWLYRDDDYEVNTSSSADNNDLNQQWTIEQIKEYSIDDETVYKRMPVED